MPPSAACALTNEVLPSRELLSRPKEDLDLLERFPAPAVCSAPSRVVAGHHATGAPRASGAHLILPHVVFDALLALVTSTEQISPSPSTDGRDEPRGKSLGQERQLTVLAKRR